MKLYDMTDIKYDYLSKECEPQGVYIAEIPDKLFDFKNHYKCNGETYFPCSSNPKKGYTECKRYKPYDDLKDNDTFDLICPVCGYKNDDAWECSDGITCCPSCGADIEVEKEITVTYHTSVYKKPKVIKI